MEDPSASTKALLNDLILDNIFSRLVLSDVKSCRVVCSKWNTLCKVSFIKLSVCCISNNVEMCLKNESIPRNLKLFYEVFPDPSLFRFTKFRIEGQFSEKDITKFFNDQRFTQELILNDLFLTDDIGNILISYNVSNWTGMHLRSLNVNQTLLDATKLVIPLSYLGTVETLILRNSSILFDGRIAPTKMHFEFCDCISTDENPPARFQVVDLNKHIDPTYLKELDLSNIWETTFRLDLTFFLCLESLCLYRADLSGLHDKLILKKLDVSRVPRNHSGLPMDIYL